jgi:hypothetical protein
VAQEHSKIQTSETFEIDPTVALIFTLTQCQFELSER